MITESEIDKFDSVTELSFSPGFSPVLVAGPITETVSTVYIAPVKTKRS
mgnify:CR=1 FL=1